MSVGIDFLNSISHKTDKIDCQDWLFSFHVTDCAIYFLMGNFMAKVYYAATFQNFSFDFVAFIFTKQAQQSLKYL